MHACIVVVWQGSKVFKFPEVEFSEGNLSFLWGRYRRAGWFRHRRPSWDTKFCALRKMSNFAHYLSIGDVAIGDLDGELPLARLHAIVAVVVDVEFDIDGCDLERSCCQKDATQHQVITSSVCPWSSNCPIELVFPAASRSSASIPRSSSHNFTVTPAAEDVMIRARKPRPLCEAKNVSYFLFLVN